MMLKETFKTYYFEIILVLLGIFQVQAVIKSGNDFTTFYEVGQFFINKKDNYDATPTTGMYVYYLPHFAAIMGVLSLLPFNFVAAAWFELKLICLFLFKRKKNQLNDFSNLSFDKYNYLLISSLLVLLPSIGNDFKLGQVNFYVAALMFLYWLFEETPWLSALCFSLASIKVVPLMFLLHIFFYRQWKSILWTLGYGLFFIGLFVFQYGALGFMQLIAKLYEVSFHNKMTSEGRLFYQNQSLFAAFERLNIYSGYLMIFSLLLLIFLIFYKIKSVKNDKLLSLSFFTLLMLMFSPDSRSAHMVILFIPILYLCKKIAHSSSRLLRGLFLSINFIYIILSVKELWGEKLTIRIWEYNLGTWYFVILFIFLFFSNRFQGEDSNLLKSQVS